MATWFVNILPDWFCVRSVMILLGRTGPFHSTVLQKFCRIKNYSWGTVTWLNVTSYLFLQVYTAHKHVVPNRIPRATPTNTANTTPTAKKNYSCKECGGGSFCRYDIISYVSWGLLSNPFQVRLTTNYNRQWEWSILVFTINHINYYYPF